MRSAGVSDKSRHHLSEDDLVWADLVLVMERKHKERLLEVFPDVEPLPPIKSLNIPDDYEYMDEELVELIKDGTEDLLAEFGSESKSTSPES